MESSLHEITQTPHTGASARSAVSPWVNHSASLNFNNLQHKVRRVTSRVQELISASGLIRCLPNIGGMFDFNCPLLWILYSRWLRVRSEVLTMASKATDDLTPVISLVPSPSFSSLLTSLWPCWPCWSSNTPSLLLPQGLCICCLEALPSYPPGVFFTPCPLLLQITKWGLPRSSHLDP